MSPQPTENLSKPIFYVRRQPRDNPGYVGNERKRLRSDETKTLDFSALCGPITGFGTQGSQVRILPLRPFFQVLIVSMFFLRNEMRNELQFAAALAVNTYWHLRAEIVR